MSDLIWQPRGLHSLDEFGILLDRKFGIRMKHSTLDSKQNEELQMLGVEAVRALEHTENPAAPFSFYQRSALLKEIYLLDRDSPVLSLDMPNGRFLQGHFLYSISSNVGYLQDKTSLLRLFEFWVDYTAREFSFLS